MKREENIKNLRLNQCYQDTLHIVGVIRLNDIERPLRMNGALRQPGFKKRCWGRPCFC